MQYFYMFHVCAPISCPNSNTSTSIPVVNPLLPLGKTIIPFPLAIDETAFDLLKPAGTTFTVSPSVYHIARTKRVNGFFLGKSSSNIAFIRGIYGVVQFIIDKIAGRANNSNPVKHAERLADDPHHSFPSHSATVVTPTGRSSTLSHNPCPPSLSYRPAQYSSSPTDPPPVVMTIADLSNASLVTSVHASKSPSIVPHASKG